MGRLNRSRTLRTAAAALAAPAVVGAALAAAAAAQTAAAEVAAHSFVGKEARESVHHFFPQHDTFEL